MSGNTRGPRIELIDLSECNFVPCHYGSYFDPTVRCILDGDHLGSHNTVSADTPVPPLWQPNPRVKPERRRAANRATQAAFRRIGERDGFTCRHCGAGRNLTVDHIVAVVNGGDDDDENFQLLCAPCNRRKGEQ